MTHVSLSLSPGNFAGAAADNSPVAADKIKNGNAILLSVKHMRTNGRKNNGVKLRSPAGKAKLSAAARAVAEAEEEHLTEGGDVAVPSDGEKG